MESVLTIIGYVLEGLGVLTLLVTMIAKFTKTRKDDAVARGMSKYLDKALSYAPTLGLDPRIQELRQKLKEAEALLLHTNQPKI